MAIFQSRILFEIIGGVEFNGRGCYCQEYLTFHPVMYAKVSTTLIPQDLSLMMVLKMESIHETKRD
jgi:hypothetical protein